jgi:hypothetical protein
MNSNKKILLPTKRLPTKDDRIILDIKKQSKMPKLIIYNKNIHFSFPENLKISFQGRILSILNLDDKKYDSNDISGDILFNHIESIQTLFIYTDLIEYQYVGDEFSPLLRNVVVSQSYSHPVAILYDNPHYVKINKNLVSSINIDIRDETGREIDFIEGKVIIKLHFRPIKKNGLQ